jgi:hypothetical protein
MQRQSLPNRYNPTPSFDLEESEDYAMEKAKIFLTKRDLLKF